MFCGAREKAFKSFQSRGPSGSARMTARPQPKRCRRLAGSDPSTILPRVLHLPPSSYQGFGNDSTSQSLCFNRKPLKAANLMQKEQGEQGASSFSPPFSRRYNDPCRHLPNMQRPRRTRTTLVLSLQMFRDHQVHPPGLVSRFILSLACR